MGNIYNDNKEDSDDIKIVIILKDLSNFWRMLNISLINCEVSLTLSWSIYCEVSSKVKRDDVATTRLSAANASDVLSAVNVSVTNAAFKITHTKLKCMYQ